MASTDDPILLRIRAERPRLRPAEGRVADLVLAEPQTVARGPITVIARRCDTSETTVVRFCRAIGLSGYAELRLALAVEIGRGSGSSDGPTPNGQINPEDSLADVVRTIGYTDAAAISDTTANLDLEALAEAVHLVSAARSVDIIGIGASGFVAADLAQKLVRIGRRAMAWADPHAALTSAALLGPEDVAIAISHTGRTVETVEPLQVAREGGARTIAVTNTPDSPLAQAADVVLLTVARETTFRTGAMSSRIAQLALVDCLFVGIAQGQMARTDEAIQRTFDAVHHRTVGRSAPPRRSGRGR